MNASFTEEQIRDMERAAKERAEADANEARAKKIDDDTRVASPVDVNSLPDAKGSSMASGTEAPPPKEEPNNFGGEAIGQPPPGPGIGKYLRTGTAAAVRGTGVGSMNPILAGAGSLAADAIDPPPNTEDVNNPALLARRNAGLDANGMSDPKGPAGAGAPADEGAPAGGSGDMGASRGSPGVLIPGGMAPDFEERDAKYGKPVAPGVRQALGEAGNLRMTAAGQERDANAQLFQHEHDAALMRLQAGESAAAQQQQLQAERDQMVSARLAEIETLNKKAQGNPEDLWSAPHVFGRMAGFLFLTLGTVSMATGGKGGVAPGIAMGMAGKFVDGLINQDIQHKVDERNQAGKAAGRQINLLHLHEERMGNQAKAINATKLAYYDNVLQQMEAYKADHQGQVNEANYNNLQAQILKEQADTFNTLGKQEQADVTDKIHNKYRQAQTLGGSAGGPHKEPDFVTTTPNGVSYSFPSKEAKDKYDAHVAEVQRLMRMNDKISILRDKARALPTTDYSQREVIMGQLNELEQAKLKGIESASKQGVLREGEYPRAQEMTGHATTGLGVIRGVPIVGDAHFKKGNAVIGQQNERWAEDLEEEAKATSSPIVHRRVAVNPASHEVEPNTVLTGQYARPAPGLAPRGSESREPGRHVGTMPKSAEETTDTAPVVPYPTDLPTPAGHHGKKKK